MNLCCSSHCIYLVNFLLLHTLSSSFCLLLSPRLHGLTNYVASIIIPPVSLSFLSNFLQVYLLATTLHWRVCLFLPHSLPPPICIFCSFSLTFIPTVYMAYLSLLITSTFLALGYTSPFPVIVLTISFNSFTSFYRHLTWTHKTWNSSIRASAHVFNSRYVRI